MTINQSVLLVIGGSDPSGGAGVQLDLRVGLSCGVHVATVITAVTAQNTTQFLAYDAVSPQLIRAQLDSIVSDFKIGAVKLGMVGSEQASIVIAEVLDQILFRDRAPVVLDPILSSSTGAELFPRGKISTLCDHLFPLASVITPNIPELSLLTKTPEEPLREDPEFLRQTARDFLRTSSSQALLLKGGHAAGNEVIDILLEESAESTIAPAVITEFRHPRLYQQSGAPLLVRGTGCFLSTQIALLLMQGHPLANAVGNSIQVLELALQKLTLRNAKNLGQGEQKIFI